MKLDGSAQRLLIAALRTQIDVWRAEARSDSLSDEDKADIENDIGYAYALLSEMESSYYREFGTHPD